MKTELADEIRDLCHDYLMHSPTFDKKVRVEKRKAIDDFMVKNQLTISVPDLLDWVVKFMDEQT